MKKNMIVLTVVLVMLGLVGLGAFYTISYRRNLRIDLEEARVIVRKTNPDPQRRDATPAPKRQHEKNKSKSRNNKTTKSDNRSNSQNRAPWEDQSWEQNNANRETDRGPQTNDTSNNSGNDWENNNSSNELNKEWNADDSDATSGKSTAGWSSEASDAVAQQPAPASSPGEAATPISGW